MLPYQWCSKLDDQDHNEGQAKKGLNRFIILGAFGQFGFIVIVVFLMGSLLI